ncbi:MAG TPA: MFS transporter [Firmicutes bacterium]|nr:MFS transporter [Candidatus Fermentithermobacillaceae bacterium]
MIQGLYILSLGFSETVLGTILSARMLSAAIFSLPAGMFSDRRGRRPVLVTAGFLTTIGYLGMAIASSSGLMILFSCILGCAEACQVTSGAPLLAESSTSEDRGRLFGVNFSLSMGVNMVGSLLGGFLPRQLRSLGMVRSYRLSLALFSLVTLLGVTPTLKMKEEKKSRAGAAELIGGAGDEIRQLVQTASSRAVWNLLFYNVLIGFGAGMVIPYFNVFLTRKLGVESDLVGLILSLSQGATAVAGLIAPILARRYGTVATVVGTQLASIPFLLLIALPPNVYLVSFALFMRSALMNMSNPVASGFSMEIVDAEKRGKMSSLMRIADNVTRSASAVVAGYVMANWSYEVPYFFTAILYVLASVIYWRAFRHWNREDRVSSRRAADAAGAQ